jgi:hypothetical protein
VTLAEIEVITQLMDVAAARGLDLKSVTIGGSTVEFARPPLAEPIQPSAEYRPFGDQPTPGTITAPSSKPVPGITHPSLWTNGKPPSFPVG